MANSLGFHSHVPVMRVVAPPPVVERVTVEPEPVLKKTKIAKKQVSKPKAKKVKKKLVITVRNPMKKR
jgi:hypothetical protein